MNIKALFGVLLLFSTVSFADELGLGGLGLNQDQNDAYQAQERSRSLYDNSYRPIQTPEQERTRSIYDTNDYYEASQPSLQRKSLYGD